MRIITDLKVYSGERFLKALSTIFLNPNFHSLVIYRLANFFGRVKVFSFISKILLYINRILYSVDIDYRADLAGGFHIIHGIGLVVGMNVKTDGPVRIYQGVTLGGNNGKVKIRNERKFSQPWLGSNVIIYSNALVVGPVRVNDGAVIGAGTFISSEVEENKIVFSSTKR